MASLLGWLHDIRHCASLPVLKYAIVPLMGSGQTGISLSCRPAPALASCHCSRVRAALGHLREYHTSRNLVALAHMLCILPAKRLGRRAMPSDDPASLPRTGDQRCLSKNSRNSSTGCERSIAPSAAAHGGIAARKRCSSAPLSAPSPGGCGAMTASKALALERLAFSWPSPP